MVRQCGVLVNRLATLTKLFTAPYARRACIHTVFQHLRSCSHQILKNVVTSAHGSKTTLVTTQRGNLSYFLQMRHSITCLAMLIVRTTESDL